MKKRKMIENMKIVVRMRIKSTKSLVELVFLFLNKRNFYLTKRFLCTYGLIFGFTVDGLLE